MRVRVGLLLAARRFLKNETNKTDVHAWRVATSRLRRGFILVGRATAKTTNVEGRTDVWTRSLTSPNRLPNTGAAAPAAHRFRRVDRDRSFFFFPL